MAATEDVELYVGWPELEKLLTSHLLFRSEEQPDPAGAQPPPEREAADVNILVPGCGKSKLSENLYDAGFKNITNLDTSEDVISDMLKRNERVRPEMEWRVMDITEIQLDNKTFDAIVDKGVLDSLMKPTLGSSHGYLYLSEVKRVLKAGGKYVCITLADRHILEFLFPMFRFGWKISLYDISQEQSSRDPKLQTFMVVAENDSSSAVYDISSFVEQSFFKSNSSQARHLSEALQRENMIRLEYGDGNDDVIYLVQDLHAAELGDISLRVPGRRLKVTLGRPEGCINDGVLLDAKEDSEPFDHPYAVFLVPHNRVHEWKYASEKGQWLIVKSLQASRLLMIFRDSSNSDLFLDEIKKDIYHFVWKLEPDELTAEFQTPCNISKYLPDSWVWIHDDNGGYIVRDVYKVIREELRRTGQNKTRCSSKLWKGAAIPNAQILAWKVIRGRLPTVLNLKKRKCLPPNVKPKCPSCKNFEELLDHLFFKCEWSSKIWSDSLRWMGVQTPLHKSAKENLQQFSNLFCFKFGNLISLNIWICVVSLLWKNRNNWCSKVGNRILIRSRER